MRILIVSDSHGRNHHLSKVLDKVGDIDLFLHLGDLEGSEDFINTFVNCRVEMISGNNDYFTEIPRERLITVGNHTIFMTHGHQYGVYYDTEKDKINTFNDRLNLISTFLEVILIPELLLEFPEVIVTIPLSE